jgi:folate-binding protein YgfZ
MSAEIEPALIPLGSAEIIEIAGPDAVAFAHAQFTSDVAGLAVGNWQYNAWLSAQGRARCVFVLLRTDADHLLAWLPLGGAAVIREALARFVLRAKVKLEAGVGWAFARVDGASADLQPHDVRAHGKGYAFAQPGPEERIAWLGRASAQSAQSTALDAWRLADIAVRLPWLDPALRDEFVPQALDLPRIDAIRFDKGCYPGQEIAARLHFRGGAKRGLYRVRLTGDKPVTAGLRVENGKGEAGVVLYGVPSQAGEYEALCVLPDAMAESTRIESTQGHSTEIVAS